MAQCTWTSGQASNSGFSADLDITVHVRSFRGSLKGRWNRVDSLRSQCDADHVGDYLLRFDDWISLLAPKAVYLNLRAVPGDGRQRKT